MGTENSLFDLHSVELGSRVGLRAGGLSLWLERHDREWVRWLHREPEPDTPIPDPQAEDPPESAEARRHAVSTTTEGFRLRPLLADAPVVIRPITPFFLPAEQRVVLHLSTPLWLALEDAKGVLLEELPSALLPETWFGPSQASGELCYAAQTRARLSLEELAAQAHRGYTQIELVNSSNATVQVERIRLPMPSLSLCRDPETGLWLTDALRVRRLSEGSVDELEILPNPRAPGNVERLPPRHPRSLLRFDRALAALWS
jgi:hypothetical protein